MAGGITISPQGSVDQELITLQTEVASKVAGGDLVDLGSTANGKGASLVGVEDAAGHITGTTVETGMAELALHKYELGLTTNGKGASMIGIEDPNGLITATTVEGALVEKLDDRRVANCADDAVLGSIPIVFVVDITDGVTGDKDVTVTDKCEIIDVTVVKKAAAGGTGDTIQVKNAGNAVTDAMSIDVADKAVVRPATMDDAQTVLSAGGTLRVTKTKASANNVACRVIVHAVRRA